MSVFHVPSNGLCAATTTGSSTIASKPIPYGFLLLIPLSSLHYVFILFTGPGGALHILSR